MKWRKNVNSHVVLKAKEYECFKMRLQTQKVGTCQFNIYNQKVDHEKNVIQPGAPDK